MIETIANLVAHRRRFVAAILLIISIPAGLGWYGQRLGRRSDAGWPGSPAGEALDQVRSSFSTSGFEFILVLECEDFFRVENARAVRRVVAACESLELVDSMLWLNQLPAFNEWGLPEPLWPATPDETSLKRARRRCQEHPLVAGHLLSHDGRVMVMPVRLQGYTRSLPAEITAVVRDQLENTQIRAACTGETPLWLQHRSAFAEDHSRIQDTAYVLVFALAWIIFRRPSAILITVAAPALGTFWTIGILKWIGEPSNELADVVLPVLIMMIGFTDGVHLMVNIRDQRAHHDQDPKQAAARAVRHVGRACWLTSLTTAIGFASLLTSEYEIIRGFGRTSAIGVLLTYVAVILVIPTLSTTWLGRKLHCSLQRDLIARHASRFGDLIDYVVRHRKAVACIGIVLTVALAFNTLRLKPDDRWSNKVASKGDAFRAMQVCDRELGGINPLQVLIQWPAGSEWSEILEAVARAEERIKGHSGLSDPLSIRDVLAVLPSDADLVKLSLVRRLAPQYWKMFVNNDERQMIIAMRIADDGIAHYQPVFEKLQRELSELATALPGFQFQLTGATLVRGRVLQNLIQDLMRSLSVAAGIILIVMAWVFRSWKIGLIAVVPNLFPLVVTASARTTLVGTLDIASACSFTICLGIAVDDTIHFLSRYRFELAEGAEPNQALRRTATAVGTALVMTTIVMMAGFGTVMTSQLPTHRAFATMAFGTIGAALIGDLIILPALLACFPPKKPRVVDANSSDNQQPEVTD